MKRDISPDEAFDERTATHYEALHRKLQGGNADLVAKIDEAVFATLPHSFWHEAVITAARADGALVIGSRIVDLVKKALLAEAEVAALREVEQLERQRQESEDEAWISTAEIARALLGQ